MLFDLEDVMAGLSVCRNQDLANVFYRLQLIEAYGTGLGKIVKAYEGIAERPIITTKKNSFKIVLPNVNEISETIEAPVQDVDDKEKRVLDYLNKHNEITRVDVQNLLGISAFTATRVLKKMVEKGVVTLHGKARSAKYMTK